MTKLNLDNIDKVTDYIKEHCDFLVEVKKFNGITLLCTKYEEDTLEEIKKKLNSICKSAKLLPFTLNTKFTVKENDFFLQFPDYESVISKDLYDQLVKDSFKWSLDNLIKNDIEHKLTDDDLRQARDIIVRQCLTIYYKSYINPYREVFEVFITDKDRNLELQLIYKNRKKVQND